MKGNIDMNVQALSMDEAKQKLMALGEHLEGAQSTTIDFARFLASRLNSQLVPMGFVMACELALYDLQKGVDGFSGQPIRSSLVGYPPMIYVLLRVEIPMIAKAIFPEEFAAGVQEFIEEMNKKMDAAK
ncbi:MAG: hypothetical protein HZA36_01360 [Parcubacteria group bacterium]|nr:hypothetical protein [Parcubacteria group bacterium]